MMMPDLTVGCWLRRDRSLLDCISYLVCCNLQCISGDCDCRLVQHPGFALCRTAAAPSPENVTWAACRNSGTTLRGERHVSASSVAGGVRSQAIAGADPITAEKTALSSGVRAPIFWGAHFFEKSHPQSQTRAHPRRAHSRIGRVSLISQPRLISIMPPRQPELGLRPAAP